MQDQTLAGKWQFRQAGTETWLPAQVPGGVHTDLLALGLIPDPYFADNEKEVQWVAESDWEFQTIFSPEKSRLPLVVLLQPIRISGNISYSLIS